MDVMNLNDNENRIDALKRDVLSKIMQKKPTDCTLQSTHLEAGFQRAFDSIIFHNPTADEIEQVKQVIREEGLHETVVNKHEDILLKIKEGTSLVDRKIIMVMIMIYGTLIGIPKILN